MLDRVGSARSGSWGARLTNISSTFATLTSTTPRTGWTKSVSGTYTVKAWVRSDNSTATAILRIREYDGEGVKQRETSASVALSPTWRQLTLTVVPAPGSSLDLNVYALQGAGRHHAGRRRRHDDLQLTMRQGRPSAR